ncbi:MAG TPA: hypothetical protein P5079_10360 [Elusimicrobiota bacterium]|nr:hypothetical protein [Elusimicrobiota bacterium]
MLRPNYTVIDTPDALSLLWAPPALPRTYFALGIAVLLCGLAVIFFRKRIASELNEQLALEWLKERLFLWTGTAISAAGLFISAISLPQDPFIRWDITVTELRVESLNGKIAIPWDAVKSVRLDEREQDLDKASLIVTDKGGKEGWLVLKWTLTPHRAKIINALAARIPDRMKPVLENKDYMAKISG